MISDQNLLAQKDSGNVIQLHRARNNSEDHVKYRLTHHSTSGRTKGYTVVIWLTGSARRSASSLNALVLGALRAEQFEQVTVVS